jgi:hypothetical protein
MLSDSEASPERGKPGREVSTLFAGIRGCFRPVVVSFASRLGEVQHDTLFHLSC